MIWIIVPVSVHDSSLYKKEQKWTVLRRFLAVFFPHCTICAEGCRCTWPRALLSVSWSDTCSKGAPKWKCNNHVIDEKYMVKLTFKGKWKKFNTGTWYYLATEDKPKPRQTDTILLKCHTLCWEQWQYWILSVAFVTVRGRSVDWMEPIVIHYDND